MQFILLHDFPILFSYNQLDNWFLCSRTTIYRQFLNFKISLVYFYFNWTFYSCYTHLHLQFLINFIKSLSIKLERWIVHIYFAIYFFRFMDTCTTLSNYYYYYNTLTFYGFSSPISFNLIARLVFLYWNNNNKSEQGDFFHI